MVTENLKSNDNRLGANTVLPLPPESKNARQEMEIYARFMKHLRCVPNSEAEIKILSAIQFTADMLDISDELVTKVLIDLGLRVPRQALPSDYLNFADQSLMRTGWEIGAPTSGTMAIKQYWDSIGEDKFAAARANYTYTESRVN